MFPAVHTEPCVRFTGVGPAVTHTRGRVPCQTIVIKHDLKVKALKKVIILEAGNPCAHTFLTKIRIIISACPKKLSTGKYLLLNKFSLTNITIFLFHVKKIIHNTDHFVYFFLLNAISFKILDHICRIDFFRRNKAQQIQKKI